MKIKTLVELFGILPEDERIIVDVLRQIIIETLPEYCKEKISYNVPFFFTATREYVLYGHQPFLEAVSKKEFF